MEQEQTIEVVDAPVSTVEETVRTSLSDGGGTSPRVLQPLHPLRKYVEVGRWPPGYGTTYVEAVGAPAGEPRDDDHHYVEDFAGQASNHHPPPVAENIVVTSDDVMGEIISVTEDVVEEEVKTSHSPQQHLHPHHLHHHHIQTSSGHHLEPNLPPGSLVKVEVVIEDGPGQGTALVDTKGMGTGYLGKPGAAEPVWPEHPEPSPPSALSLPSTSTIQLLPVDGQLHRLLSSNAPTNTTFVYARPVPNPSSHLSPSERIDETVNEVILSVTGRDYGVQRSGLPSFPSILTSSGSAVPGIETVMEEVLQPPPPMPSQVARPQPGPVTIVKTRRPRSQLTDEDRRFRCSYCDKAFTARSSLDVHERIHTGERPYKCSECGKTFRHCGHLTCHLRTHTGERPYVCRVCGKGFTQSTPCRRHEQTQHNLSP